MLLRRPRGQLIFVEADVASQAHMRDAIGPRLGQDPSPERLVVTPEQAEHRRGLLGIEQGLHDDPLALRRR